MKSTKVFKKRFRLPRSKSWSYEFKFEIGELNLCASLNYHFKETYQFQQVSSFRIGKVAQLSPCDLLLVLDSLWKGMQITKRFLYSRNDDIIIIFEHRGAV